MKPFDWNCKMRSSEGREFVIEGHFDKPNAFSRGQGAPTRTVTIKISKHLQFEGSGTALMGWSSDRDGWHQFEVRNPSAIYQIEIDYIEPNKRGYRMILSSNRESYGGTPIWQFYGHVCSSAKPLNEHGSGERSRASTK